VSEKLNILVVDDDAEIRDTMANAFMLRGWDVTLAVSLADARLKLVGMPYTHAVIDLNLPDGLGTELLPEVPSGVAACIYTGLPEDVRNADVPVFSKGDPFALFDWLKEAP
jgi:DNA-binding NtrC family response regulator